MIFKIRQKVRCWKNVRCVTVDIVFFFYSDGDAEVESRNLYLVLIFPVTISMYHISPYKVGFSHIYQCSQSLLRVEIFQSFQEISLGLTKLAHMFAYLENTFASNEKFCTYLCNVYSCLVRCI